LSNPAVVGVVEKPGASKKPANSDDSVSENRAISEKPANSDDNVTDEFATKVFEKLVVKYCTLGQVQYILDARDDVIETELLRASSALDPQPVRLARGISVMLARNRKKFEAKFTKALRDLCFTGSRSQRLAKAAAMAREFRIEYCEGDMSIKIPINKNIINWNINRCLLSNCILYLDVDLLLRLSGQRR